MMQKFSTLWIDNPFNDNHIAVLVLGDGYLPYRPYGGRHIMDDFGNLVKALPMFFPHINFIYPQQATRGYLNEH